MASQVLWGELGEHVVDQLAALSSGVMLPLLSNTGNTAGVPIVLAHEVTENLHHFITTGESATPSWHNNRFDNALLSLSPFQMTEQ